MTPNAFEMIQDNIKMPSLHPPTLKSSSHKGYIEESAEMGTIVRISPSAFSNSLQISVYDDDLKPGMPPAVYEYILTGLGSSIFAVDQRGYVYLNVPYIKADPPNPSTYQLHIEAREVNTIPIRSSEPISITIYVMDINDNPPRFNSSIYMANVSASGSNRPVIKVHATDNDAGKNAEISYHLISVSNEAYNNFWYDSEAHQLNAIGNLKAGEQYEVVLKATDGGGLSNQAVIVVYAIPDNFHAATTLNQRKASFGRNQIAGLPNFLVAKPRITSTISEGVDSPKTIQTYVVQINEATPPYSAIITLGDDSTKRQMYYMITGGNEDKKFAINSEIGTLITVASLDREEMSLYSLQIETRSLNSDQHLYWIIVQVDITDINDNAPIFTDSQPMRLRVKINDMLKLSPNMYVGKVNVEDPDDGDNGHMKLRIASPMDKLFSINDNGIVMVNGNLLNGHFGEHRMTIIATDHGNPPLETRANLIINIENAPENELSNSSQLSTESSSLEQMNFTSNNTNRLQNLQFTFDPVIPAAMQTVENLMLRFAPVFDPSEITIIVKENQANIELAKLHAYYMDNKPGNITYIMFAGNTSIFSVNSFTGSLVLLRPLDVEEETTYEMRIGTAEAAVLLTDSNFPHTVLVTVNVVDVNDWKPNFEFDSYQFKVNAAAKLGTAIGQIMANDKDRTMPNNEIRYRIKENNTNESYISIDPKSGLLTVKKDLRLLVNKKILLNIEAEDGGIPKQFGETLALIDVEPREMTVFTETSSTFDAIPSNNKLQFSQRNYSISLSESVHSPHTLLILPVLNKSTNESFTTCSIISGNYEGLFSISTDAEGNCELRTQALLDRETTDYYQLKISVETEQQVDYATVEVTILDTNDNAPKFIYKNDEYNGYFAALSTDAPSFTYVTTVQAEVAGFKNNSVVAYSLDPFPMDSKYFMVDLTGEIQIKMSASQMMGDSQKNYFNFRVIACDSPLIKKKLCSKAEIFVNIISDSNRFILSAFNINPRHLKTAEREIAKVLREFTDPCKLLFLENVKENQDNIKKLEYVDMYWYAVNPITKTSCKVEEYSKLFNNSTIKAVAAKLKPRVVIGEIRDDIKSVVSENVAFLTNFKTASVAMIVLAVAIAVGALIGICGICLCYIQHSKHEYPNIKQIPKFGAIFLPNPSARNSHDIFYETQMLELPIEEEDSIIKPVGNGGGISAAAYGTLCPKNYHMDHEQSYLNYAKNALTVGRKEGNMKMQGIVIPAPDYPMDQKKSVF
ncbi:Cadherin-99C [Dirofilaria immitis]